MVCRPACPDYWPAEARKNQRQESRLLRDHLQQHHSHRPWPSLPNVGSSPVGRLQPVFGSAAPHGPRTAGNPGRADNCPGRDCRWPCRGRRHPGDGEARPGDEDDHPAPLPAIRRGLHAWTAAATTSGSAPRLDASTLRRDCLGSKEPVRAGSRPACFPRMRTDAEPAAA